MNTAITKGVVKIESIRDQLEDLRKREKRLQSRSNQLTRFKSTLFSLATDQFNMLENILKLSNKVYSVILIRRYLLNDSWDEVQAQVGYKKTNTFDLHLEAIEELEKYSSPH